MRHIFVEKFSIDEDLFLVVQIADRSALMPG